MRRDRKQTGKERRPVRGQLQLSVWRLRSHGGEGGVFDLRGHLSHCDWWVWDLRGGVRAGEAAADCVSLQDFLHVLPEGHQGVAGGASCEARRAQPSHRPLPLLCVPLETYFTCVILGALFTTKAPCKQRKFLSLTFVDLFCGL